MMTILGYYDPFGDLGVGDGGVGNPNSKAGSGEIAATSASGATNSSSSGGFGVDICDDTPGDDDPGYYGCDVFDVS